MPSPLLRLFEILLAFYCGGCTLMLVGAAAARALIRAQAEVQGVDPSWFAVGVVLAWPAWALRAFLRGGTVGADPRAVRADTEIQRDALEALKSATAAEQRAASSHVEAQAMIQHAIVLNEQTLGAERRIFELVAAHNLHEAAVAAADHALVCTLLDRENALLKIARAVDANDPERLRSLVAAVWAQHRDAPFGLPGEETPS